MQIKSNFLTIASLAASIAGLAMIYFTARNIQPETVKLESIDGSMIGKVVSSEGSIISRKNHGAGHIFLTIADGGNEIDVPIFSSLASKLDPSVRLEKGNRISVTGNVNEYKGQIQIIPRKKEDVRMVDFIPKDSRRISQ